MCGATEYVLSYNVVLDTEDLPLGRRIAAAVREASGGLPHVEAMAFRHAFSPTGAPEFAEMCGFYVQTDGAVRRSNRPSSRAPGTKGRFRFKGSGQPRFFVVRALNPQAARLF